MKCNLCHKEMKLVGKEEVSDSEYNIYFCKNCNRKIAKSEG